MGRGIALLLLQEMALREAEEKGTLGSGEYALTLIDADEQKLFGLWRYFKPQLTQFAIQQINRLRRCFSTRKDLIENGEIIQAFVEGSLAMVRYSSLLEAAKGSKLVFEAAIEDIPIKIDIYQTLNKFLGPNAYYLTNTSSIPIDYLAQEAGISPRLIGFHFYNPPPLQKLVEIIPAASGDPELLAFARTLGETLKKTCVYSKDVAGFIGNGHFMRELVYASKRVEALATEGRSFSEAVYLINWVSQYLLVRPMGIFQLVDFVGLDVCQHILSIMRGFLLDETLRSPCLEALLHCKKRGGIEENGQQQPGFFTYEKGKIKEVYSLEAHQYVSLPPVKAPLEEIPSWSALKKEKERGKVLKCYWSALSSLSDPVAEEAKSYAARSQEIARELVQSGVAERIEDVHTVLELGFSHLFEGE